MVAGSYAGGGLDLPWVEGSPYRRGKVGGIDVIQIDLPYSNHDGFLKRTWLFLRFALAGIKIAFKEDHDLLFATSTPLTAGIPGIARKLFRRKTPFVFEVRDLWPELPKAMGVIKNPIVLGMMGFLERRTYAAADALIGLSPGICDGIRNKLKREKQVLFVPNAADIDLFKPTPKEGRGFPGISDDDFVAVFTGAHGIANGLHAVLDAAAHLIDEPRIKFLFIGDGRLKPQLIERAEKEGLLNCVFHDPIPKTELAGLLPKLDLGLMILQNVPAFYRGTSPNKFFDYIASGIPVLNNYPGWLAEEIENNDCGIVVPPGDPKAFADAVSTLFENNEICRKKGANARKLAEERFNRERSADACVDFFENLDRQLRRPEDES